MKPLLVQVSCARSGHSQTHLSGFEHAGGFCRVFEEVQQIYHRRLGGG
jgi:hypothetical protein